MKGITYCGACVDYDFEKHRCKRGAKKESNPQDKFFDDCPLPTVVPVVRCRDCKHYMEHRTRRHGQLIYTCLRMAKYELAYHVCPDDFCSYGERKDNDEF